MTCCTPAECAASGGAPSPATRASQSGPRSAGATAMRAGPAVGRRANSSASGERGATLPCSAAARGPPCRTTPRKRPPAAPTGTPPSRPTTLRLSTPARALSHRSHEQVLRDRRLKRRVDLLTARSAVATLQRELSALRGQRTRAQAAQRRLRSDAAAAVRAGRAAAAASRGGWQLGVVRAHNERLAQPEPVEVRLAASVRSRGHTAARGRARSGREGYGAHVNCAARRTAPSFACFLPHAVATPPCSRSGSCATWSSPSK
jgi:hypothetical protein